MMKEIKKMSTNGAIGFYKNGVNKIAYNHWDSYPSELGNKIVNFIKSTTVEEMNEIFDKIILVDDNKKIYESLKNYQGDLSAYKNKITNMIDASPFMKDSLFCEWAYIINLDTSKLEVYRGFSKVKSNNRYQPENADSQGYWGVSLFVKFSLDKIPNKIMDELEKTVCDDE